MQQNLTPSGVRALAATMVRGGVPDLPPYTAAVMIDALDSLTRALLVDALGLSPHEARTVLDHLWAAR